MAKGTWLAAAGSCGLTALSGYGALQSTGLLHELFVSLFGTFSGALVAILAVNIYLSSHEKRYAATPLVALIQQPMNRYHNDLFIQLGRDTFGISKWNSLIDNYTEHRFNPDCFTPEDRFALVKMIDSRLEDILDCIRELEITMSDLISVLSWSFDPKIVGQAISCKQNISEFRINVTKSEASNDRKKIETYFDIEATGNGVLRSLAALVGFNMDSEPAA